MGVMPHVTFHFNVPDVLHYTCRLARKAGTAGQRLWVITPQDRLGELDALLWTFAPHEFISHAVVADPAASLVRRASVALAPTGPADGADWPVVVNLLPTVPDGAAGFSRLIELVSVDEAARLAARTRWKRYRAMGMDIAQHDVALSHASAP